MLMQLVDQVRVKRQSVRIRHLRGTIMSVGLRGTVIAITSLCFALASAQRNNGDTKRPEQLIHIVSAEFGDKQTGKACTPDLSICEDRAECSFDVDDSLCTVDAPVKNLEVHWNCGPESPEKAKAAATGTKIT